MHRKRKKQRDKNAPSAFTRADKLQLFGVIAAGFLVFLILSNVVAVQRRSNALDKRMDRWRTEYHLSEEQARRVRRIEESFHGKNPLLRRVHTPEEIRVHHQEIASVMNAEDGARFFARQEGKASKGGEH